MRASVHDDPFGDGCKPTGSRVGARIPQLQIEAPSPLAGGLGVSGSGCGAGMELFRGACQRPLCRCAVDWRQPFLGSGKLGRKVQFSKGDLSERCQRLTAAGCFGSAEVAMARWLGELVIHVNLPIGGVYPLRWWHEFCYTELSDTPKPRTRPTGSSWRATPLADIRYLAERLAARAPRRSALLR